MHGIFNDINWGLPDAFPTFLCMKTNSLNTYKFCKEFDKIFGPYKSKRLTPKQGVLFGWWTFISSPYSNFVYEISLYLNIPVSEVKQLLTKDCQYLYPLCEYVYKRFRKRFRKNGAKSGLATYISGQNLHKCLSRYRYD